MLHRSRAVIALLAGLLFLPALAPRLLHAAAAPAPGVGADYGDYYTWPEILERIAGWEKSHRTLISRTVIGQTVEGRDILALKISDNAAVDEDEPEVLLMAGIHAREQPPQVCLMRLLSDLFDGYGKDARITRLIDEREIWAIPILNVDGKLYDMENGNGTDKGAEWRKNRRKNADGTFGLDLNRNFPVRWGGSTDTGSSSPNSSSAYYQGAGGPFTEPEARALDHFLSERPLRAFVDLHSPFKTIFRPAYLIAPEHARYTHLIEGIHAAQKDPYPATRTGPGTEPAARRGTEAGVTHAWAYYAYGIYAINIEVYAAPKWYPPFAQIHEQYERNIRGALLHVIDACAELPLAKKGSAELRGAKTDRKPAPGAVVEWTPTVEGKCAYGVLVSLDPSIRVTSEYRLFPLKSGFVLQVTKDARPGTRVPMRLYLWDADRGRSVVPLELEIEAGIAAASARAGASGTGPAAATPAAPAGPTAAAAPAATSPAAAHPAAGTPPAAGPKAPAGAAQPVAANTPGTIRAALFSLPGASSNPTSLEKALAGAPGIRLKRLTPEQIRAGALRDFDVLVQPGGSAHGQSAALEPEGLDAVRAFVRAGGGYVGFCAGAYLASADCEHYLEILNAEILDSAHWQRGTGTVRIGLSEEGRRFLGAEAGKLDIYYANGPLLAPAGRPDIPAFETLATYETEMRKNGAPVGVMRGTPAIVRGRCGEGRVVCFSPHPEKTEGLGGFVVRAVRWAAGK